YLFLHNSLSPQTVLSSNSQFCTTNKGRPLLTTKSLLVSSIPRHWFHPKIRYNGHTQRNTTHRPQNPGPRSLLFPVHAHTTHTYGYSARCPIVQDTGRKPSRHPGTI